MHVDGGLTGQVYTEDVEGEVDPDPAVEGFAEDFCGAVAFGQEEGVVSVGSVGVVHANSPRWNA